MIQSCSFFTNVTYMKILMHKNDIPDGLLADASAIAVDTEAMGLMPHRDRLCLVQLSAGDGICHLVQFDTYNNATNLTKILKDKNIIKIFHYARFDVMIMYKYLGAMTENIYCTKIASKLVRTYSDKHSLLALCKILLDVDISKEQTCTDWGSPILTEEQKKYAATDVLYLHKLKEKLDILLERENRVEIAQKCFDFIPTRV